MRFDLSKKHALRFSDLQYAVVKRFYDEGPDYVMPVQEVLLISGNTLNSLLDPRGRILEETRGHGLKLTKDGYIYMTRFEGRNPYKEHFSRQFCAQMRQTKGFNIAAQLQLIKKVTAGANLVAKAQNQQPPAKLFRVDPKPKTAAKATSRAGVNTQVKAASASAG